jgi:hypothetical protein
LENHTRLLTLGGLYARLYQRQFRDDPGELSAGRMVGNL